MAYSTVYFAVTTEPMGTIPAGTVAILPDHPSRCFGSVVLAIPYDNGITHVFTNLWRPLTGPGDTRPSCITVEAVSPRKDAELNRAAR